MTRARILVRRVHLWLGLSLGLLFAILGLTGSALVFYVGIDAALHPQAQEETLRPAPGWTSPVWDRTLATARAYRSHHSGKWSFEASDDPRSIPARFYPDPGEHGHHAAREMVWFSPDGATVLRAEPWGGYLMSWLYELHMHLLAGEIGAQIVGWSGVAMLVLLISGALAWWPRGSWSKALAFKRDAVPIRRLHDLHKLTGVWSVGLLAILVATGVLLALPSVKAALLPTDPLPAPRSAALSGPQVPITRALAAAHRALPDGQLAFIDVPPAGGDPIRIRVQVPGDPHRRFPGSFVFVDQHSAQVLAVHDVRRGNTGTRLTEWIRPLHDGSVGGLSIRILAVLVGLAPTFLFVTGLLRWQRRRAARTNPQHIALKGAFS